MKNMVAKLKLQMWSSYFELSDVLERPWVPNPFRRLTRQGIEHPMPVKVDLGLSRVPTARRMLIGDQLREINKLQWDKLRKESEALLARKLALERDMEKEIDEVERLIDSEHRINPLFSKGLERNQVGSQASEGYTLS